MNPEISLFEYYALTSRKNVLVSYKGPVSDVILAEISRDIRSKFADNPKVSRQIFSVFMELAQNILYYSSEKIYFGDRNDSVGTILVTEGQESYTFSCGNMVKNEYVQELFESCEVINSMNKDELREYKRAQRNQDRKETSKGAGIGLIQVAITAETPLEVEFKQVDEEHTFFALSVKILKNSKKEIE